MTGSSDEAQGRVRIETDLPAAIQEVYAAWTEPKAMARWLAPTGCDAEVEADVRVGGRLRVVMRGNRLTIEHTGEYVVVEPPHRLSFTWLSTYTGAEPSVVTVTLTPQGNATHLLLVHERLPADAAESHRGGWGAMLQRLVDEVLTATELDAITLHNRRSRSQNTPQKGAAHGRRN
jgi:uncharacterized protein YndB with AHSA1/START domain